MEKELRRSCSSVPILVVDRDTTSLMCLASMLEQYSYNVTTTELAAVAISMIRKGSERFKLVLADISNDEMNTLSLLIVSVRMNIPVILMSNETNPKFAQQLIGYGASLHLQKPISLNDLKYLWQHAFRRPRVSAAKTFTYLLGTGLPTINDPKGKSKELTPTDRSKDDRQMLPVAMGEEGMKYGHGGSMSETSYKFGDKDGEKTRNGNSIASRMNRSSGGRRRKTRLVWSKELHHKFAAAITALGDEKTRPKYILKMMNEPNLTHRQIASHLQKHKAQMNRTSRASPRNSADASTSIYGKPGFFYLPQTPEVTLKSTGSAVCFNRNQQWHQKLNYSLDFDLMSSMNPTLQLPPSMPGSTGNLGNQIQNQIWSQTTVEVDKSGTEVENRAAIQSEKWTPEQSAQLVDLLKVLDDDADVCMDPAIEPNPAEVDQVCEWLKEAMLENDQNP